MRAPIFVTLLALGSACNRAPAPATHAGVVVRDVQLPVRDLRFPSGLRVIIEEDHRSPVAALVALVGTGSADDPPGKEGLAHFVEHLSFRSKLDGGITVTNA